MTRKRLLLGVLLCSASALAQPLEAKPFLLDKERGWFWYEQPPAPVEPAPKPKAEAGQTTAKPTEVRMYEQFKAGMEEARIVAMFNPTQANVERYVQYRTALVKLADQLAEAGQRVVWANPEYDFTQARPVSAVGLQVHDVAKSEQRRHTFDRLAKTHVLYFFFKADCPYCHAFSPVLLGFSQATGIKIFPVSLDGGACRSFLNRIGTMARRRPWAPRPCRPSTWPTLRPAKSRRSPSASSPKRNWSTASWPSPIRV